MIEIISAYYLWIKALHVIFVICWMAGLFYLPRLFVYHTESGQVSPVSEVFQKMEYRLYRFIMKPAMHLSLVFGILLAIIPGTISSKSFHLKFLCVVGLIGFQYFLNHCRLQLARGNYHRTSKFFRIINEIPTLLLIVIVICVIVKPF